MHLIAAALLAAAGSVSSPAAPDSSAPPDSTPPRRIVRQFPAVEVSAGRVHDLRSTQSVHIVTADALRDLPVAGLTEALALQPGVVSRVRS